MARIDAGILSAVHGKVGGVVGRKWRGMNILTEYNKTVRNPRSAKQLAVRDRFRTLTRMAKAFGPAIRLGMVPNPQGTSGARNLFFAANWPCVTVDNQGVVQVQFAALDLTTSLGLPLPTFGRPDTSTEGKLKVSWTGDSTYGGDSSDNIFVFLYNPSLEEGLLSAATLRSGSQVDMVVPATWSGSRVHVYGFALKGTRNTARGCDTSATQYLGEHELE